MHVRASEVPDGGLGAVMTARDSWNGFESQLVARLCNHASCAHNDCNPHKVQRTILHMSREGEWRG
eukprot:CAMPEP_0171111666 /NCGR_PEP_ID=MMETSP0766_2-20121228/76053_1 /TAXON_ID=439317 /ORGANISM="Gambierdiscus australes, Strain CAWD 149" /LENGTH=65 /DNA_ID=CAMNT_0011573677 /DNA_START=1 /DNA_END=194 /DNA_ORIENTATION=+